MRYKVFQRYHYNSGDSDRLIYEFNYLDEAKKFVRGLFAVEFEDEPYLRKQPHYIDDLVILDTTLNIEYRYFKELYNGRYYDEFRKYKPEGNKYD